MIKAYLDFMCSPFVSTSAFALSVHLSNGKGHAVAVSPSYVVFRYQNFSLNLNVIALIDFSQKSVVHRFIVEESN